MDATLESLFNLYVFTTGRGLFAIRGVRKLAEEQAFTQLVDHCDSTIAYYDDTRALELRWSTDRSATGTNPVAQRIDVLGDTTLGALRDTAVAQAKGAPEGDPIHQLVADFLQAIFPLGVHAVTSLGFVEESARVDDIVTQLQGPLAPSVTEIGLTRLANRLADLAAQYRKALEAPSPSLIDWGHVRAARAEAQGRLLEAIAIIVGKHHARTPEGTAARLALLAPILKQQDAIGAYLRARRAVDDVDPETGEDQPTAPGPEPGAAP